MIRAIIQIILAIFVFRLVGSLVGLFKKRSGSGSRVESADDQAEVKGDSYDKITPYEIEDAEYEELPKGD